MRLREIETRVLKLERDPENSRLGRMSEEELDAEIVGLLNYLAADHPTYDAMIDETAALPELEMQECARQMRWFLYDYLPRKAQAAVQ